MSSLRASNTAFLGVGISPSLESNSGKESSSTSQVSHKPFHSGSASAVDILTDDSIFFSSESTEFTNVLSTISSSSNAIKSANCSSSPPSTPLSLSTSIFNELLTARLEEQQKIMTNMSCTLEKLLTDNNGETLRAQLTILVRLAYEAPHDAIRNYFTNFLKKIKPELDKRNIEVPTVAPPSKFFSEDSLLPLNTTDPTVSNIFSNIFSTHGYISHIVRVLVWHPIYFQTFVNTESVLMGSHLSPLKNSWAHYLALLAAASFKCAYLVQQEEREFLLSKGDRTWLEGRSNVPVKIRNLDEVNEILAHQPWRLTTQHFEKLISGVDSWSLSELVHALLISASYRALASFVWSMGITSEVDFRFKETCISPRNTDSSPTDTKSESTMYILEKLIKSDEYETEENCNVETFLAVETCFTSIDKKLTLMENSNLLQSGWTDELENLYCADTFHITHSDFDVKSPEYQIFHIEDFSWSTHGFSLVKRWFPLAANVIDEGFKCIKTLTYKSFGTQNSVETAPFRLAIWYYVHRVFGIFYDDYNYQNVNEFVPHAIKSFVKNIAFTPWRVKKSDLNFEVDLLAEEKAHIALLVLEARRSAELLYALKIVSKLKRT